MNHIPQTGQQAEEAVVGVPSTDEWALVSVAVFLGGFTAIHGPLMWSKFLTYVPYLW